MSLVRGAQPGRQKVGEVSHGWVVVALSLSAALAFAVSSSLKHASAGQVPDAQDLHPKSVGRLVLATLAHPLWLGGHRRRRGRVVAAGRGPAG